MVKLQAKDLEKSYPGVKAVDGLSFSVAQGVCYGLLGPNGAGKTTTLEMLEGIVFPDSGSILYQGKPVDAEYKQSIGIQFQTTSLQDYQTVREALHMFSALYRRTADIAQLIEVCHLGEFIDRDTRQLSGGQRQRLLLAIALVNDPDVVFLDEPTTGLDPQSRRKFWELIEDIKKSGKTIILTTHYMEEAYRLCDLVAIVDHGKIIIEGEPDELLNQHFPGSFIRVPVAAVSAAEVIPSELELIDHQYELLTEEVAAALQRLDKAGVQLDDCRVTRPTLEDLFLKLTGHSLRN